MLPLILLYDMIFKSRVSTQPPKLKHPVIKRRPQSKSDYMYYLIDLIVSIVAISFALIVTTDKDLTMRMIHLVMAILFRYVYLGYLLLNRFIML